MLNALRIDPKRLWKTPWRWFTEDLLERSCESTELDIIKKRGITMEQFQSLSERNGAWCKLIRPDDSDECYEEFLQCLYSVCSGRQNRWQEHSSLNYDDNSRNIMSLNEEYPNRFLAISFYREALEQNGNGHYSPVAAFDLKTNTVLILDTARFKYPPYWVPVRDLYRSMIPIDIVTGESRGYFVVTKSDKDNARG
jgi:glutathione gamma-glutamylcysteinyltransferase